MQVSRLYWFREHQPMMAAIIPGTTEIVRGGSSAQTFAAWQKRCAVLGLSFANAVAEFHDSACRALPPGPRGSTCAYVEEGSPELLRRTRLIHREDIEAFFKKTWAWWRSGELVPQETADDRASICACCPQNVPARLDGCRSCDGLLEWIAEKIRSFIGDRRTPSDHQLQHCGVCGCNLKVIVHAPIKALQGNEAHEFPGYCWQKPQGEVIT